MKKAYSIVYRIMAFTSIVIALALLMHGCATPPRPEVIYFEAQPQGTKPGDPVKLKWQTENAVKVEILGIGEVPTIGSRTVYPNRTSWYTLIARNEVGDTIMQDLRIAIQGMGLKPSIIYFRSDPRQVFEGDTARLEWETVNADEVEISRIGSVPLSGYRTVQPREDTEYELTARNAAGKITSRAFVGISPRIGPESPPVILYFRPERQQVEEGKPARLEWSTENADEVEISRIGSVPLSGYRTVQPREDTEYELTARNAAGKITSRAFVGISPRIGPEPPVILYFKPERQQVEEGNPAKLEWSTENADEVEISRVGRVPLSGYRTVQPREDTEYELIARNAAGETTSRAFVGITPGIRPKPPLIIYFRSDPRQVMEGDTARLEWKTENAVEAEISGIGSVPPIGYREVELLEDTEFQLIARNAAGEEATKEYLLVTVVPKIGRTQPRIKYFKSDKSNVERGEKVRLEWETENAVEAQISGIGRVHLSGYQQVQPQKTTIYRLAARNAAGEITVKDLRVSIVETSGESSGPMDHAGGLSLPEQLSPKNGTIFRRFSKRTLLQWVAVKSAAYYEVEVQECHPSGCEKGARPFKNFKRLSKSVCHLDAPEPSHWRWRVWAVDSQGNPGPKSKWWEFRY